MQLLELRLPLRGTDDLTGEQVVAIGLLYDEGLLRWLVIEGSDGRPSMTSYGDLRLDWRYDPGQGWVDTGATDDDEVEQPQA